jgi:hypothetical protein
MGQVRTAHTRPYESREKFCLHLEDVSVSTPEDGGIVKMGL